MRLIEVLRTQYIGAIVAGFIGAQGILTLLSIPLGLFNWYFIDSRRQARSVFDGSGAHLDWAPVLVALITAALYLLTAYALVRWIYSAPQTPEAEITLDEPA